MRDLCLPRASGGQAEYPKASEVALPIYMWATPHHYSQKLGDWFLE